MFRLFFSLGLAWLVSGCSKSVPTADSGSPPGGEKPAGHTAGVVSGKPIGKPLKADVSLTPDEFHAEYKKDPKAVQDKYMDKVIELSGVVSMVTDDPFNTFGYIFLEVKGNLVGVRVATLDRKPWLKVSEKSTVKVWGKIDTTLPGLYQAWVIESGPNPALTITANDLAKEFKADKKAASAKYHDKFAHVEGVVAAVGKAEFCPVQVTLKTDNDVLVKCCFGGASFLDPVKALKPGKKVKVFGKLAVFDFDESKEVSVDMCLLSFVE
jgi:hypothetical protein